MPVRSLPTSSRRLLTSAAVIACVTLFACGIAAAQRGNGTFPGGRGGRRGAVAGPPANAVLGPDGTRIVWVGESGHEVWGATRENRTADWAAPDRLLTIRGTVRNIVFSPDGRSIAFENPRSTGGDAAIDQWGFIDVFDFATRQISYVDPTFDIDTDPVWSSDGTQISFVRHVDGLPDAHLSRPVTRLKLAAWRPPPRRPQETFTLESVLAAPFVYAPQPAADGRSLAYVTREGTHRDVYYWRLGEPARRLAEFGGDDGQELTELAVSPTGGAVAFVRGIAPNPQGDLPNPDAVADPPRQQVWIAGAQDAAPHFLAFGSTPHFTPDNRRIVWSSDNTLLAASLTWQAGRLVGVGSPQPFFAGDMRGLRFSPDGSHIAYQLGQAIEIYDLATRTAVVIPHAGASDQSPTWSPDGKRLAFRRQILAGYQPLGGGGAGNSGCGNYRYCGPAVSAQPWSIWSVDLATLQPHQVWEASQGLGSIYYALDQSLSPGQEGDQMFWSANDRIAFVWERDGWRHLYSVPVAGGTATLMTPGDGEVETAAISIDRTQMIYATNIGDLGRRHIAAVDFDGSAPHPLTSGDTSQWAPTPLAQGSVGYIAAGWADPPAVMVRNASATVDRAALPRVAASFPASALVKPQLVEFPASDGQTAYGQLLVPRQPKGCAIIFSHGGIKRQMLPGFHYLDMYTNLYELNQYLASRGCVVLSVEYRSSIMRGEAFRDAPGWGFAGNSEMLDFLGAAKYLEARKDVQPGRLGIYGLSWGGYMTANALSQHSDIFKVGFDMAGVHSSTNDAGVKYSAMGNLSTWTSPVFLAQGDDDRNVSFTEGIKLARAMQVQRPGVEFVQRVLPGQTHDLYLTMEQLVSVYTQGADFLLAHVGVQ